MGAFMVLVIFQNLGLKPQRERAIFQNLGLKPQRESERERERQRKLKKVEPGIQIWLRGDLDLSCKSQVCTFSGDLDRLVEYA
jgi:hypothetical protein